MFYYLDIFVVFAMSLYYFFINKTIIYSNTIYKYTFDSFLLYSFDFVRILQQLFLYHLLLLFNYLNYQNIVRVDKLLEIIKEDKFIGNICF